MTILAILISTAVAVAVVFVLHTLDKENNSMNKVKHYADSRINQLDEYFKEQISKLNGLSAEWDAHHTTAAAAVNRIEKQIADFKQISSGFDSQFEAVSNISKKVDAYGRALQELMEMTDRVEENLQAVKKESAVVDRLNAKIDSEEKAVAELEKKIPSIIKEFREKNNDSLKLIGADMLNKFTEKADQIEKSVQTASAHSEEVLSSIQQQIRSAYDSAAQKAKTLEDDAFKKLFEQAKARADVVVKNVNEKAGQLSKAQEEKLSELQKTIEKRNSDFSAQMTEKTELLENEFRSKTNELTLSLGSKTENFSKSLETKIASLTDALQTQVSSLDEQIKQHVQETRSAVEEIQNASNGNGKNLAELREKLETQTAEIQNRYSSLFEKAIADADEKEQSAFERYQKIAENHLNNYKMTVEEKINSVEKDVNNRVTLLNQELTSSVETIQKAMSDSQTGATATAQTIEKATAEARTQLESFQTQADEKIANINKMISDNIERISSAYDAKQTELLSNVDKQLEEYRSNMEYRFNKLQTTAGDIDTLENNLRSALERTQNSVVADFAKFSTDQQTQQNKFEESVKHDNEEITAQIENLEKSLESIKATASSNVSATLADFESKFGDDLKKRGESITEELNNWKNSMDSKLAVISSDYENSRREIETSYSENLKTQLADISSKNHAQIQNLETSLETSASGFRAKIDAVEKSVSDFTEQSRAALQEATNGQGSFVKTSLESYNSRMEELFAKSEKETQARLAELEESINGQAQTNQSSIDSMLGEFNVWRNQLKNQFEQTKNMFTDQLTNVKQSSDQKISVFE